MKTLPKELPKELHDLYGRAVEAREHSYSPYSRQKVGAAIRVKGGKIYAGCNVENSSFGATVCAERAAILSAVSENGPITLEEVMVVTDASPAWPPCGMCRQVIAEFGGGGRTVVHLANLKGELRSVPFKELFPDAFTPEHLRSR